MIELDVRKLLAEIDGEGGREDSSLDKTASASDLEPMEKLAEECESAGIVMGDAMVDRAILRLEKLAMDHASSSHASAGGVTEPSNYSRVAQAIQKRRSGSVTDADSGHIRAEQAYKHRIGRGLTAGRES